MREADLPLHMIEPPMGRDAPGSQLQANGSLYQNDASDLFSYDGYGPGLVELLQCADYGIHLEHFVTLKFLSVIHRGDWINPSLRWHPDICPVFGQ